MFLKFARLPACVTYWEVVLAFAFAVSCRSKQVPLSSDLKMSDKLSERQLIDGFYQVEANQWRWAARRFAVVLPTPVGSQKSGVVVKLNFYVPDFQIESLGPMTLDAHVGDVSLGAETFTKGGIFTYTREIPPGAINGAIIPVVFEFDKSRQAGEADARDIAAIVNEVLLQRTHVTSSTLLRTQLR